MTALPRHVHRIWQTTFGQCRSHFSQIVATYLTDDPTETPHLSVQTIRRGAIPLTCEVRDLPLGVSMDDAKIVAVCMCSIWHSDQVMAERRKG